MSKLSMSVRSFEAVTPDDDTDLERGYCDGIHVNVAGDVSFVDESGNIVTLTLTAGTPYPYGATRIRSTGTTATGIYALYGG